MNKQFDRRGFLKALGITGVAFFATSAFGGASAAVLDACDKVDPKKSQMAATMAKALKYVPVSKTKGQKCEGCLQFKADATKKTGTCAVIQGCSVANTGWCSSWAKKA
jgi:hypothetical protein